MHHLSQEFIGHEQDVRDLCISVTHFFSCSRDGTVREWDEDDAQDEVRIYQTHTGFVNSIAYYDGYIYSGGQDCRINVVKKGTTEVKYSLLGHTGNVCALYASHDGHVVSGSWDGTAKLWKDGKCLATMEGHEGAVWAVLYTEHGILTGGADRTIRLWQDGRQIKNFPAGKDCIRALQRHPFGFASAGNDATIRVHTFDGEVVQELEGHESFIYSLAVTVAGTIYSVGEDRTLKIWNDGALVQTIAHPAVSVWCVDVLANGDVVTGSSDAVVRVFTESEDRKASEEEIKAYERKVAAAAVPAQSATIPNNLPGLEALAGPGSKEGEVKMIRTAPDLVEAHQWSGGIWTKIGEVMGATSKKVEYEGKEWDFVFDVDIAEGVPPLKLPYNTDENPYEAANRFIEKYELDVGFQAQIVKFIETNTGGIPLGVPKSDTTAKPTETQTALTPQTQFLSMLSGNAAPILKKLQSLCSEAGSTIDISILNDIDTSQPTSQQVETLLELTSSMPRENRFPCLDLLRLCIPKINDKAGLERVLSRVREVAEFDADMFNDKTRETNIMLSLRSLANIYSAPSGLSLMSEEAESVLDDATAISYPANRNLSLAYATFLLNTAVYAHKQSSAVLGINLADPVLRTIRTVEDSEVRFRCLIALGTIVRVSGEVREAVRDVFEAASVLRSLDTLSEQRIKDALAEIRSLF